MKEPDVLGHRMLGGEVPGALQGQAEPAPKVSQRLRARGLWYFQWMFRRVLQTLSAPTHIPWPLSFNMLPENLQLPVPFPLCPELPRQPPAQKPFSLGIFLACIAGQWTNASPLPRFPAAFNQWLMGAGVQMPQIPTLEWGNSEAHCFPEFSSRTNIIPMIIKQLPVCLPNSLPPKNYLHLNRCLRICIWDIQTKRARKKVLLRKFQLWRGGFNEAEPGALANLQHQQDGWNDQAWIGDERKDLAQEGWKIIFNGLLYDVIHSVFPTGKKRTHYSMLQSSHGTWLCACPSQSCRSPLSGKNHRSAPDGLQIKMSPKGLPFWLGIIARSVPSQLLKLHWPPAADILWVFTYMLMGENCL